MKPFDCFCSKTYCWWKKSSTSCWIIRPMLVSHDWFTPQKTNMSPENQWLEDVYISYWNSPLFRGHVKFPGCKFTGFTGVLHPNWCHESFLKHQLMSGCFPVGASLNHCCRHFFPWDDGVKKHGVFDVVPNGWERVPLSNPLGFKHHQLEGPGMVYYFQFAAIFLHRAFNVNQNPWELCYLLFPLFFRLLHEKNQEILRMNVFQSHWTNYWDRLWCSLEKRKK